MTAELPASPAISRVVATLAAVSVHAFIDESKAGGYYLAAALVLRIGSDRRGKKCERSVCRDSNGSTSAKNSPVAVHRSLRRSPGWTWKSGSMTPAHTPTIAKPGPRAYAGSCTTLQGMKAQRLVIEQDDSLARVS